MVLRHRPPRGADGKRRQRLKGGFRTRADAERALAELLTELDQSTAVDPSRQTLGEYLDDWLAAVGTGGGALARARAKTRRTPAALQECSE